MVSVRRLIVLTTSLQIAPALHPPYIISSGGAMNWTVSLSWGTPFFISVADSGGKLWATGLLHSGGPGTTDCLGGDKGL